MENEVYLWDMKEKQESEKPYAFTDRPEDFLDHYFRKRGNVMKSIDSSVNVMERSDPYLSEEMIKTEDFETSRVISTLYSSIRTGNLNESESRHFWRLLKKAELRKLKSHIEVSEMLPILQKLNDFKIIEF